MKTEFTSCQDGAGPDDVALAGGGLGGAEVAG